MEEGEKRDILAVLKGALVALRKSDVRGLRDWSNRIIHCASIFQDRYSLGVAVLVYSLSKIYERKENYSLNPSWSFFDRRVHVRLKRMVVRLRKDDLKGFDREMQGFFGDMKGLDKKLKKYVADVIKDAKITKASRLYEHGLSLKKTARLFGLSEFDLVDYVGTTYIADVPESFGIEIKERLRYARSLFK